MTFERLRLADWVVFVAALALLFTTAPDWYSTKVGEEARKIEQNARPEDDRPSGQSEAEVQRAAGAIAEGQERNAWEEDRTIDRIILVCLLATSALGVLAGFWRAGGREARGLGPYALAGLMACVTALLVLYRILQEPGFDELTTVKIGAPLALGVLGVYALAAASSLREPAPAGPRHVHAESEPESPRPDAPERA